jgi:glycosyltransferase involved in cell wall biosynthesis
VVDKETRIQNKIPARLSQRGDFQKEMSSKCPKLLFLAWRFPPVRSIACVRTWNIAKYLSRLGWNVTVVTPHQAVWRYVDNPAEIDIEIEREGIRRILTDHRWRCLSPNSLDCRNEGFWWLIGGICRTVARHLNIDYGIGWSEAAMRACSSTLAVQDTDIIFASGPPFTAFTLARRLSERLKCPYVLDYRDPWTANPHSVYSVRPSVVEKEAWLLDNSAAVTIVSHSWRKILDLHFNLDSKLHVITNGYDPEELSRIKPRDFGHFAIVYAGTLYPPKRTVSPLLAALRRLKEITDTKREKWYFHYYGEQGDHVRKEAERFGVAERTIIHGNVSRTEALSAVRGAGVAVVITSVEDKVEKEDLGIIPGKIFDTVGLRTPTLLIAPNGSEVENVAKTIGFVRRFPGSDVDGIVAFLSETIFSRVCSQESPETETYAWPQIAKRLDVILRDAIKRTNYNREK